MLVIIVVSEVRSGDANICSTCGGSGGGCGSSGNGGFYAAGGVRSGGCCWMG